MCEMGEGGCSKILIQPYRVSQISQAVLMGVSSCCKHNPCLCPGAMEQPCHSLLTVTQGLAVTPGGPAGHPEHQVSLAWSVMGSVDATQKAKITGKKPMGGLAHPTPPCPPQLICQLQGDVRQAAASSGAWGSVTRPSSEQHVAHCAQEKPGPRQGGLRDPPAAGLGAHPEVKTHHSRNADCSLCPQQQGWVGQMQEGNDAGGRAGPWCTKHSRSEV